MIQVQVLVTVLSLTYSISGACQLCTCDLSSELTTGACALLFKDLEKAVLEDEGNLYRMRRAFFYSPTASPVLLKVVYNVSFSDIITDIPSCGKNSNLTSITLEQRNITYGWSSSGVYTVFHPTVLNMMQAQIPFAALRIVHKTLNQRSPEADTFLWDGSYNLPMLYLNMHITALSCLPSQDLFESVLVDFNTLLKVYTAKQEALDFVPVADFIGFTLPNTSVTTGEIPIGSDVIMANVYSSILWALYATNITLFLVWYYRKPHSYDKKRKKEQIHMRIRQNKSLVAGMVSTAITTIAIEACARVANCIVWAVNTDNSSGVFLAVWLPQGYILFLGTGLTVFYQIAACCFRYRNKGTSKFLLSHIHIILPLYLTAFGLLHSVFPAIILILAYPTQMIAIMTFVLAYLFATTIFSTILIHFYSPAPNSTKKVRQDNDIQQNQPNQQNYHNPRLQSQQKQLIKTIQFFVGFFIPFWLVILCLHCIAIVFLYSLLIGSGSAINTVPLIIVSLLPSALVSGMAWIAKRVALNEAKSANETSKKQDQALQQDRHQATSTTNNERVTTV